jgi:hypothetical protein
MFAIIRTILEQPYGVYIIAGGLILFGVVIVNIFKSLRKRRSSPRTPQTSSRSSSIYWGSNSSYLRSRFDDLRTKSDKQLLINRVIELYTRNGSLAKTARATGLTERKVKRILIRAGKYTTQKEADRIFAKYR